MGPFFMAASFSQYIARTTHQDLEESFPHGYLAIVWIAIRIRLPSRRPPPESRPGSHSARLQPTACGQAQRSISDGSVRVQFRPERETIGSMRCQADVAATAKRVLSWC